MVAKDAPYTTHALRLRPQVCDDDNIKYMNSTLLVYLLHILTQLSLLTIVIDDLEERYSTKRVDFISVHA